MGAKRQKRGTFKGSLGFVMAAAGSAVGLGNIWRFPYLAARDGGGLFLIIYIILALTFGFAMLTSEIAIGRKTRQSPLTAYKKLSKKWGWIGVLSCVVPFLIMPYYCVIGGWVLKYLFAFITGQGAKAAADGYFNGFISNTWEPLIFLAIFLIACAVIIFNGVSGGIEKFSKILMPILILFVVGIAVYSLTLKHTGADGTVVTGLDGLKTYLVPSFEGVNLQQFFRIVVDALMQLFYSLSIAMGILIAYGSYVPDEINLGRSITHIEIFDTAVAFLAGIMIIPAVLVFMGPEGMSTGPSLMFISLPKVFAAMGTAGNFIGAIFFAMVFFAALTSGISIMEAVISSCMDKFQWSRKKSTVIETAFALVIGVIVCLGYNLLYFEIRLPNMPAGKTGQILDVLDYISNYILMPVIALATCILVGWILKPKSVIDEVTKNGEKFGRAGLYKIMTCFISPIFIIVILLISLGVL